MASPILIFQGILVEEWSRGLCSGHVVVRGSLEHFLLLFLEYNTRAGNLLTIRFILKLFGLLWTA